MKNTDALLNQYSKNLFVEIEEINHTYVVKKEVFNNNSIEYTEKNYSEYSESRKAAKRMVSSINKKIYCHNGSETESNIQFLEEVQPDLWANSFEKVSILSIEIKMEPLLRRNIIEQRRLLVN
jgi:hypothetical protein